MTILSNQIIRAILSLCLFTTSFAKATDYHIDSRTGNDANPGTEATRPWKSLTKVNSMTFQPGDSILFAAGSRYTGLLSPNGRGQKGKPIRIDHYGRGSLPLIEAQGEHPAALLLKNVDCWEVRHLELSNTGPTAIAGRYGILISNDLIPVARHFVLQDLLVRDVNGSVQKQPDSSAAIYVTQGGSNFRFDEILIAGNIIRNCSRNGIVIKGGPLRGPDWNPSTKVIIRKNLIEGVGGDGILPTSCKAPLVEWNIMRDCPRLGEECGAAAGMWPWACDDALFQFNEVSGHKAWVDAQAYDCDYSCHNTTYQYNLSYDNEGGFMLLCSPGIQNKGWLKDNAINQGSRVQCNLSINDGSRTTAGKKHYFSPTFSITGNSTQDTVIEGNLIIIPKKPDPKMDTKLFHFGTWGGNSAINTRIVKNTFILLDGQEGTFEIDKTARRTLIEANTFYGKVTSPSPSPHVIDKSNRYLNTTPIEVTLTGSAEKLTTFKRFLAVKQNPQEKKGIKIKWITLGR
jgi:hypothetical protein